MAEAEPANAPSAAVRLVDPAELDAKLAEIAASPTGPASHFGEFWFDMPIDPVLDPLSAAYRDVVQAHHSRVAGAGSQAAQPRPTDIAPDDRLVTRPWPYNTGSAMQIGRYLQAVGFILATCQPRPGHRVLQMGIGDLDLALPLSLMGCAVTAVDPDFGRVSVLRRRAERAGVPLLVEQAELGDAAQAVDGRLADFVIFPSTLQHHLDHLHLIGLVRERLLARGGRVVLAGEPLLEAHPTPWGLQQDGACLWSMRHGGRLSLVFRPSYLVQAFAASGQTARLCACSQTASGNLIIATRSP